MMGPFDPPTRDQTFPEWDRNTRPPVPRPPKGSTDCQLHIFGDPAIYPPKPDTSYQPPDATFDDGRAMLRVMGFDRVVIVYPMPYGTDNRLLIDTLEGAEFIDELAPAPGELIIHKHRYSAFKDTDLDMILRARSIKTVITTGVSTNVCVESTLRDAFETGYYVCIPSDATASWDMSLHNSTLQTVTHRFGLVTTTEEIEAVWTGNAAQAAE